MNKYKFQLLAMPIFIMSILGLLLTFRTTVHAQESTPSASCDISAGVYIQVISPEPQIHVRGGPSSNGDYPIVGALVPGQIVCAFGRSPGGDWVQISYPGAPYDSGWVYSPLVKVFGTLRVVEPPPTPIPPATPTIDPTLLAQFSVVPTITRLPTFTPAPALSVTSFTEAPKKTGPLPVPMASAVIFFALIGVAGFLLSFIRRQ